MDISEIKALIRKRRTQCLVQRYTYYVLGASLVADAVYDGWERELRDLVDRFPEIANQVEWHYMCPSKHVGSSLADDYPRSIEQLAVSLVEYAPRFCQRKPEADAQLDDVSNGLQGSLFG